MLLTTRQLIEMSGRSRSFVYTTLKKEGIDVSDFYDDSVLRYFKKDVPEGLLSAGQMAEMTGLSVEAVRHRLYRAHIKAAFKNENERLYDASVLEAFKRKRKALTDEEKKERQRKSKKKYYWTHKDELGSRAKGGFYFVSVRVPFNWRIVACSLSYLDARMIADELNALGIRAHFKSHTKA